jgi:hypothetical protein
MSVLPLIRISSGSLYRAQMTCPVNSGVSVVPSRCPNLFEDLFDLSIVTVINPSGNPSSAGVGHRPCGLVDRTWEARVAGLFGATGNVHRTAMAPQCDSDAAAGSPTGTGDQCDRRIACHDSGSRGCGRRSFQLKR